MEIVWLSFKLWRAPFIRTLTRRNDLRKSVLKQWHLEGISFEGTFFEGSALSHSPPSPPKKKKKPDKSIDFHQRSIAPKKFIYSLENFIFIRILLFFLRCFVIITVFSVTLCVQVFSLSFFLSFNLTLFSFV